VCSIHLIGPVSFSFSFCGHQSVLLTLLM
jgi:hypothetical protein